MKKVFQYVGLLLLGWLLLYGFGSLVAWTPNVSEWDHFGRYMFAVFGIIVAVLVVAVTTIDKP